MNEISIGEIGNEYGGLSVCQKKDGRFYWDILSAFGDWEFEEEIPKSLYLELVCFEEERRGVKF